jgi:hypothetical protein
MASIGFGAAIVEAGVALLAVVDSATGGRRQHVEESFVGATGGAKLAVTECR